MSRGLSRLRLSVFVQISEFFSIYITDICQTSASFAQSVNLKYERAFLSVEVEDLFKLKAVFFLLQI